VNYNPDLKRRCVDLYTSRSAWQHEKESACLKGPQLPSKGSKKGGIGYCRPEEDVGGPSLAGYVSVASSGEPTKTGQKSTNLSPNGRKLICS
jgi:hypothetical protein